MKIENDDDKEDEDFTFHASSGILLTWITLITWSRFCALHSPNLVGSGTWPFQQDYLNQLS